MLSVPFLLGCSSDAASPFGLYSVNVTALAEHLKPEGSGDIEIAQLLPPELPTFWSFGLGGKTRTYIGNAFSTSSIQSLLKAGTRPQEYVTTSLPLARSIATPLFFHLTTSSPSLKQASGPA
jgi:hypothetical protein